MRRVNALHTWVINLDRAPQRLARIGDAAELLTKDALFGVARLYDNRRAAIAEQDGDESRRARCFEAAATLA
mgnify:CR=1 FL=1